VVNPTYVLDTDLFTLYVHGAEPLTSRITAAPPGTLFVSITTVEESLSGWYTALRQAHKPDEVEAVYERMAEAVTRLGRFPLLVYTRVAMAKFDSLQKLKLGVRSPDLRIAAIALVNNATVVTRNVRDFGRVPGLAVEDWSAP
jgi:tRNA(fMet)-specific endonuclease VapC